MSRAVVHPRVCVSGISSWNQSVVEDIDRIGVVQVSDFAVGTLSTPNRLVPGDGDIPLARIIGQLLDAGCEGAFDLELVGPRIEQEGSASAIARSVEHLSGLLKDA